MRIKDILALKLGTVIKVVDDNLKTPAAYYVVDDIKKQTLFTHSLFQGSLHPGDTAVRHHIPYYATDSSQYVYRHFELVGESEFQMMLGKLNDQAKATLTLVAKAKLPPADLLERYFNAVYPNKLLTEADKDYVYRLIALKDDANPHIDILEKLYQEGPLPVGAIPGVVSLAWLVTNGLCVEIIGKHGSKGVYACTVLGSDLLKLVKG